MLDHTSLANLERQQTKRASDGSEFIGYADIAQFVKRNRTTILGSPLITIVGAILYILVTDPIFTARSQILIDPKMPQLLREQTGEVNFSLDNAQVESQIAVLRSEKIALTVINELKLREDPDFQDRRRSIFATLRSWIWNSNDQGVSEFEQSRHAVTTFEAGLDVRRYGLSYAIDISFGSKDPEKAARIANATADAFIRDQVETKSSTARLSSEWLEERINQLRAQLNTATQMVQEFRAKHDYRIRAKPDKDPEGATPTTTDPVADGHRQDITLEELETTAETYRKIYESYLQAFTATVQRQSFPVSDARVITPATRPLTKSHPKTMLVLAIGGLFGLMIGCAIAFVLHSLDRSIRSSQQIRDELGLECLGRLPRIVGAYPDHFDEVAKAPFSRFSSKLKSVKTVISLANKTQSIRCLGITSALPKEGKSTVASNLATLFSMSGVRTLVVDADICNSTLTKNFAPNSTAGLIEAVKDREQLKHCIVPAKTTSFDLLPAVTGPIANSNDILGSEEMQVLLRDLFQSYDFIVVDLPPLNPVVDGLAISPLLDGVVVVTEWGKTPLDLISEMLRSLRMAKAFILGVVMTKVDEGSYEGYGKSGASYYS